VALAVGRLVMRVRGRSKAPKGARWATGRDLASLRVRGAEPGRLVPGRFGGSLIAAGERASTLVMGPTQVAGKSSRVVIPALLEWGGPVLTTSIKRDVVDATLARRQQLGEVKVFDPLGRTGMATASWSPVAASATWTQAREVAAYLMQVGWSRPSRTRIRTGGRRRRVTWRRFCWRRMPGAGRWRMSAVGSIPRSATSPSCY